MENKLILGRKACTKGVTDSKFRCVHRFQFGEIIWKMCKFKFKVKTVFGLRFKLRPASISK